MPQIGLDEIERRVRDLAQAHHLEECLMTEFGTVASGLYARVEQDEHGYHFVTPDEDGLELERRTTKNADDILFWVICDAASRAALNGFAAYPSGERRSFRLAWFESQLEILGKISKEWRRQRKTELDEILRLHPEKA